MSMQLVKRGILSRSRTIRSLKVKNYVRNELINKIDMFGDSSGFWLESVIKECPNFKPVGLFSGWKSDDFKDLSFVLTGHK